MHLAHESGSPQRDTGPDLSLPGLHASPNIQSEADVYEIENQAADPDRLIEAAMWSIAPWNNKVVLDLGAGTGFHVPRFHEAAAHVIAIEPHGPSHLRVMARASSMGLDRVSVIRGSAADISLRNGSVEIVHARFAYFFGPGSEPGLAELERVVRPGGTAFIIDNDLTGGTFARWLKLSPAWQCVDPTDNERFFQSQGFTIKRIRSEWRMECREDLEAVVRIELPDAIADHILREHEGTRVSYHYLLMHRTYGRARI
jgi:SAM-dependent methyltransferase